MLARVRITFGTRQDASQTDAFSDRRPARLHTPLGVTFRSIGEAPGQSSWSLVLGAGVAIGLGLWTWRALFALLFPELPELPAQVAAAEPALGTPAAVHAPAPVAPPPAAAVHTPPRSRKPAARLPPPPAASIPTVDPEAEPDMDLTDAPSSPLELRALAEVRAHEPVSLAALPPITPTYLNLNSRPWSEVYVDGQHVGHTPLRNMRLLPGRYTVELVNRQFGMGKHLELLLLPGDRVTRSEELEEN